MQLEEKWTIALAGLLAYATATAFIRESWAPQSFQIGAFLLFGVALFAFCPAPHRSRAHTAALGMICCLPLWGIFQISAGLTASPSETRLAVLRWAALAAVFCLATLIGSTHEGCRRFLDAFLWFATALSALSLTQLFTSKGRVLWTFDTGYTDFVYGTFPSYNNYAQFVELALPLALWRVLQNQRGWYWYALAAGALYASVIGCSSRAGSVLCTVELVSVLIVGLVRSRRAAMLALVPVLALVLTLVVGWERVWARFGQQDSYFVRREFLVSAIEMVKQRPLTGFGLGTYPVVYQRYAIKDFPFYANHAHNDWAEFAADGGIPFLAMVLVPFLLAAPAIRRHPWAIGLAAVTLHACVDYPFPRPAVSGWILAMLGILYATDRDKPTRYSSSSAAK